MHQNIFLDIPRRQISNWYAARPLVTYIQPIIPQALEFTADFCCDYHEDSSFRLANFLPGPVFSDAMPAPPSKRKARLHYRPMKERCDLDSRLITWLRDQHRNNSQHKFRSMYDILSHKQRTTLVRAPKASLTSPDTVVKLLDESEEWRAMWSSPLFELVKSYDQELLARKVAGGKLRVLIPRKKQRSI